jgi:predicted esterase
MQSHGKEDMVVPFEVGLWLKEFLEAHRISVDFVPFNGSHEVPQLVVGKLAVAIEELLLKPG